MPSFFLATTTVGLLFLLAQNSESELGPPSNAVPSKQALAEPAVDPDFQPPGPAATAQNKAPNSAGRSRTQELRKPFVDVDALRREAARQESLAPPVNSVPSAATPTQAQDDGQHRYTKRWLWKRRFGSRSRSRSRWIRRR